MVYLPLLGRATIVSGTDVSVSQGQLSDPSTWRLDLAAGARATYEVHLNNLMYRLELFAQVIHASEDDMDSTPDNGYCCTATEDDEAAFPDNSDTNDDDGADDTNGDDTTEEDSPDDNADDADDTEEEDQTDDGDSDAIADITLSAIQFPDYIPLVEQIRFDLVVENLGQDTARGEFVIGFYLSEDASLSDEDIYIGHILTGDLAVGQHPATALISIAGGTPLGTYHLIAAADVDEQLAETNESNNIFSHQVEIQRQNGVDLELNLLAANPTFPIYTNNEVTLTLTNTGNEAASGVQVSFPIFAAQVVLVGGTQPDASQGTFNGYTGIWDVQDMAAGASATLRLQLYSLMEGFVPYAQVSACEQEDIDSVPNNGVCCTANEDDEATVVGSEGLLPNPIAQIRTSVQLAPNPASNKLWIQGVYEETTTYRIYDSYGKLAQSGYLYDATIQIADLASGIYYIQLTSPQNTTQLLRFMKAH